MDHGKAHFNTNWYELWIQQSQSFFEISEKNLKKIFTENAFVYPQDHFKQIQEWQEALKKQWEFFQVNEEQKGHLAYWKMLNTMYKDTFDLLLAQWTERAAGKNPIKNIRELYELWLNCCHEIYQKSLHENANIYGDFFNAAMKFWQTNLARR